MNKIEKVVITKFWGDKTVDIAFSEDVNFLIGVNGSGKTTVINLIAATLKADFKTLDSYFEFSFKSGVAYSTINKYTYRNTRYV